MPPITYAFICPLADDTELLALHLGNQAWAGLNITLKGPLGAGKTVFARGLARGLGISEAITSPSYPIIQQYPGRLPFYHMDWYRLSSEDEVLETGAGELLGEDGVCLVEWPDRALELFDASTISVEIAVLHEDRRRIAVTVPDSACAERLGWWPELPPALAALPASSAQT